MNYLNEFDSLIERDGLASGRDLFRPEPAKKAGVVSFSFAETDFHIPSFLKRDYIKLIESGFVGYTVPADEAYLDSIVNWFKKYRKVELKRENIVPTLGMLRTMSMTIRAFSEKGDGVIVLSPGYTSYEPMIENNGRTVVRSSLVNDGKCFRIDFADLEEKMSKKENRILFLCNPHNPTMTVWSEADLRQIAHLSGKYGVYVVVDETFADLTFDPSEMTNYSAMEEGWKYGIVINTLSKSFNVTGLNSSNAIIMDMDLKDKFYKTFMAEQRGSGSIEPFARTLYMSCYSDEGREWLNSFFIYVKENIALLEDFLKKHMPGVRIYPYDIAYLVWVDFRALGLSDRELEEKLFNKAVVCVDMGYKYGPEGSGFARFHLGTSHDNVRAALDRLKKTFGKQGEQKNE